MRCIEIEDGYLIDIDPQPSDVSTCELVVAAPGEIASPWVLTESQGAEVGVAILTLWAGAFVVRMLIRLLTGGDPPNQE